MGRVQSEATWVVYPAFADCLVRCQATQAFEPLGEVGEGELRGSVDGHEEIEHAFLGADLGDVDVAVADGISLEPALAGLGVFHLRKPGDAVALQAAMQR